MDNALKATLMTQGASNSASATKSNLDAESVYSILQAVAPEYLGNLSPVSQKQIKPMKNPSLAGNLISMYFGNVDDMIVYSDGSPKDGHQSASYIIIHNN